MHFLSVSDKNGKHSSIKDFQYVQLSVFHIANIPYFLFLRLWCKT